MSHLFQQLATACLLIMLTACATPLMDFDTPDIELVGLRPLSTTGMEARFALQLRVTNPNTTPLNIDGMQYAVFLRNQRVLSGVTPQAIRIPAYDEDLVDLEASVGVLGSLRLLRDLLATPPEGGLPYRLETKLSVAQALRALRINKEGVLQLRP